MRITSVFLGPVFGFSTAAFNAQRDAIYDGVIEAAATSGVRGLIATCIFEPSVKLDRFEAHVHRARSAGDGAVFIGLECEPAELERRMTAPDRGPLGKWNDYPGLRATTAGGYFDVPDLPWTKVTVDSTGMSATETAQFVFERLPAEMRRGRDGQGVSSLA